MFALLNIIFFIINFVFCFVEFLKLWWSDRAALRRFRGGRRFRQWGSRRGCDTWPTLTTPGTWMPCRTNQWVLPVREHLHRRRWMAFVWWGGTASGGWSGNRNCDRNCSIPVEVSDWSLGGTWLGDRMMPQVRLWGTKDPLLPDWPSAGSYVSGNGGWFRIPAGRSAEWLLVEGGGSLWMVLQLRRCVLNWSLTTESALHKIISNIHSN